MTNKILKAIRLLLAKTVYANKAVMLPKETDFNKISDILYDLLQGDKPCMIARFGATELSAIVNYLGVKQGMPNIIKYIKGEALDWWWYPTSFQLMKSCSGFFPSTEESLSEFSELMIKDIGELDVLASWCQKEIHFQKELESVIKISLLGLEPFWSSNPWTRILKGKKVLVIHPFSETILSQYERRESLFKDENILPKFDLQVIKAVQSLGGSSEFSDWFEALEWMKSEIDKRDFDICLIGCGAYGFPLAAHVKRIGKKAVHIGGALQLFFGIRGSRWDREDYKELRLKKSLYYKSYEDLYTDTWVFPAKKETPANAKEVEDSCYWKQEK